MRTHRYFRRSSVNRMLGTLLVGVYFLASCVGSAVDVRMKDIVRIEGIHDIDLIGYGIVVGLNGTGDKDLELTKQTMANLLDRFNVSIPSDDVKSKNVAVVMVSASAPAFHSAGDRTLVRVSAIGDAASLEGGVLLMTPLQSPDGTIYALAQGALTVSGFTAGSDNAGGQQLKMNYTTVGTIPDGALLRYNYEGEFIKEGELRLSLNHPDFTTANRLADAINQVYEGTSFARDAGTVTVHVPQDIIDIGQTARFVASLEGLRITPDMQSKIVINERSGTIVMGGNVHIDESIVAHGNLTVRITSNLAAYMPEPFSSADPVVTNEQRTQAKEDDAKVVLIPGTATIQELAALLNEVGTTPRDLISILEALKTLGALQMDIETM